MKITFVGLLISLSMSSFAGETCTYLRFEAQDFLCTLEAKVASDSVGTTAFEYALEKKIKCLESFSHSCEAENEESEDFCIDLRFEAQDFLCTLEAKTASDAVGTDAFKDANGARVACLDNFTKSCNSL